MREHLCVNDELSSAPTYELLDGRGIYLSRVCERCEREKLSRYRPEILTPYSQADVDEDIDGEYDARDWA